MNRRLLFYVSAVSIVALLGGVAISHGRVFIRWGSRSDTTRTIETSGGSRAYDADVRINGTKGHITVFGFNEHIGEVVQRLRAAFGSDRFVFTGGSMGYATINTGGKTVTLIAIWLQEQGKTVLFKLVQSTAAAEAARRDPERNGIKGLPLYPDSEILFSASDLNARMSISVASTPASATQIHSFFASHLASDGWIAPVSDPSSGATRLAVYLKPSEVCCISVDDGETSGMSRITLLHKSLRME